MLNRDDVWEYVSYGIDDALSIRNPNDAPANARLIGWQGGFEPVFVAVWSYLGSRLDDEEAVELATDLLVELGWFEGEAAEPEYVL